LLFLLLKEKIQKESAVAEVKHDQDAQEFYIKKDGKKCYESYKMADERTMDFHHTETPPALRGQGLAEKVVEAGMEYAREKGYKVIPTCPYVEHFFEKHPDYQDLRAEK
jgi:predicted GNAT family acetyltransferase